ncbi:DUF1446 domain-containing protein [Litorilinea aerophila]|uniref:acyclic terpene utilization AtuA family protein n=1 Tax=Litorilinea aerophila TaxID=1204385 RepID=UPI000B637F47|nr:hypothetical protein [Litorilinea aerophila]MCC9076729.1 DUF1446 domain-containing protein [Litorilinea aerophila]OUC08143.1 hypothetical protein RY27_10765 [Litorilinea aerophila]
MSLPHLAIGCAAGFGGDRTDAAGPVVETLIESGLPGVLIFEMLAERTLAVTWRLVDPDAMRP